MNELLTVRDLSAGYGGRDAVKNISFVLAPGEVCALVGANGSGKTTLLRAVCGLIPARGDCLLCGKYAPGTARERAALVSYLGQQSTVHLELTGLDVVMMGFYPALPWLRTPNEKQAEQAREVMRETGALSWADRPFQSLSCGQRQQVLWARTLLRPTPLLMLDEPDSALDLQNRQRLFELLVNKVHGQGRAALLCSHDVNLSLRFADRLLFLQEGRVTAEVRLPQTTDAELRRAFETLYGPVELMRRPTGGWMVSGIA